MSRGPERVRIAAVQLEIERPASFAAWADRIADLVRDAADTGADLVVFPEYGLLELTGIFEDAVAASDVRSLAAIGTVLPEALGHFAGLARRAGVHILAPSAPEPGADGRLRNVARLYTPAGGVGVQEKIVMTRFERAPWGIVGGGPVRVFDTALGRFGVAICYDVEFPLIARAMVEAGAEYILAPSCTDTLAGFHRVRTGARARALEGQCVVVQVPTVGMASWSGTLDANRGAAGFYGPPDDGFPDHGVIAQGPLDIGHVLVGEVDRAAVRRVRRDGQVLTRAHWPEQGGGAAPPCEVVRLD
jgi:predicted amidohydrolase